jgi:hypothetical protein
MTSVSLARWVDRWRPLPSGGLITDDELDVAGDDNRARAPGVGRTPRSNTLQAEWRPQQPCTRTGSAAYPPAAIRCRRSGTHSRAVIGSSLLLTTLSVAQ